MSKEMTIIVLGVLVVVVPYLGIPGSWKVALFVLAGLGIALTGFLLRGEALARGVKTTERHPFVENNPSSHSGQTPAHDQNRISSLN